ncbi:AN1-type zinc finger domain-containing protein [Methanosarcina sp. T3]|uniref:AN1-type zinc finger domain-containing protein n=1 Tax=Methanosarcina sp. T3 TaxID=3439062 RepID=UPI003F8308B3
MTECSFCGIVITHLSFKCKYCGERYCANCSLPEEHDCVGIMILNIKNENKFYENAMFIATNYEKVDDRGYEIIEKKLDDNQ